jgi:hypothetical protein
VLSIASALLLAQTQAALPPSQPPEQEPQIIYVKASPAPPARRDAGERVERETGLTFLAAGYVMGALIVLGPPLFTKNGRDPVRNGAEKRLGLVPLVGPMLWWLRARARLDARGCSGCYVDLDSGFHDVLALPYAVDATGAQAIGAGLLTYGIFRSHAAAAASRAAAPVAEVSVAPTPGGLSLQGTF